LRRRDNDRYYRFRSFEIAPGVAVGSGATAQVIVGVFDIGGHETRNDEG
jgi:hypothetical protein